MKNIIVTLLAVFALSFAAVAQTNTVTESSGKTAGDWEITLGGGGFSLDGENSLGVDFSVSTNPFDSRPEVWVGLAQGVYWDPSFSGSSDLFVDWSQNIWNETLYANVGWFGGVLYDNTDADAVWRTGPELTLQYYTSDDAFVYAGVNYDVFSSDDNEGSFRYYFGIGLSF